MASTEGRLIYAVGDIHGCLDLFRTLLDDIHADMAARRGERRPVLVLLGDYIDRGPEPPGVLDLLLELQQRTDIEVRLLKGNHEQALLDFLDRPERGGPWLGYGGADTLEAYGVDPPGPFAGRGELARAAGQLAARMPEPHLQLLRRLELMVVIGDYAFVHAGVRPGAPLAAQAEDDLLWIRHEFLDAPGPFEKTIVHGHTWFDHRPQLKGVRLGLDTGAVFTGVLTAARLDGESVEMIQARAAASRPDLIGA